MATCGPRMGTATIPQRWDSRRAHIGIHARPLIFQDGDVYGRTVNIASRLASVAQAGEVVVSEEVAQRADGFSYEDMGLVTLKGVTAPLRLFRAAR